MDAHGWGALPWVHGRFQPMQRTGCSWMLVEEVLSHGRKSGFYLFSAQDTRGCSWMLVDGVLSHGPMSDAFLCSSQEARGCSWMW